MAGDRSPGGLDLTRRDPRIGGRLHAERTEVQGRATFGDAVIPAFVALSELGSLGLHHGAGSP
jgi:hypothetical protein